jgi:ribonuclease VapC
MVLDTSALLAILLAEPEAPALAHAMAAAPSRRISAVTWLETAMVVTTRRGERGADAFRALIGKLRAEIVSVDQPQAETAYAAWLAYGKGRNPAALNLGDCFSYALAKHLAEPLLFKGDDFSKTDIRSAL